MDRYNPLKFKNMVHYVCHKCSGSDFLGSIKLNKILWLSESFNYINTGKSISGEKYIKQKLGPVPRHILGVIGELIKEGSLEVNKVSFHGLQKTEYISHVYPDIHQFTPEEISRIDDFIDYVCDTHTAKSISNFSHNNIWEAAMLGEEIPHYAMFALRCEELTEADIEWAKKAIAKIPA